MTLKGVVLRFGSRGYGYIQPDGSRESLFFHINDVVGRKILQTGDRVEFQIQQGKPLNRAILVTWVASPDRLDRQAVRPWQ